MFGLGWIFGGSSLLEVSAQEKEQKDFLFLLEDLCKYKILYIVYSQNKCHELPNFNPDNKSKHAVEALFEELSVGLKADIRKMLAKEIDFANTIIEKKQFGFIKPISLDDLMHKLYFSALFIHDSISKFSLDYDLLRRVKEIVEQLNQIENGWKIEYEVGEITDSERIAQEEILKEHKEIRELIARREKEEEKIEESNIVLLTRATLRVTYTRNKLEKAQEEWFKAQEELKRAKKINKKIARIKLR